MKKMLLIAALASASMFANATITNTVGDADHLEEFNNAVENFNYEEEAKPSEVGMSFGEANRLWIAKKYPIYASNGELFHLTVPAPTGVDTVMFVHTITKDGSVSFKEHLKQTMIDGYNATIQVDRSESIRTYDASMSYVQNYSIDIQIKINDSTITGFYYELPASLIKRVDMTEQPINDFTKLDDIAPPTQDVIMSQAISHLKLLERVKIEKIESASEQ